jgi:phosphatidylserine/phosphatidylglycerophosphate/cardiolipin synthase-like enzyme
MGLPLQPDLHPWTPWQARALLVAGLVAAVLALGFLASARHAPPALLATRGLPGTADYLGTVERLIAGARQRVWLVMFVIRLDEGGSAHGLLQALAEAAARGVRVQVALDSGREWNSTQPSDKHVAPAAWLRAHGVLVVIDELDRTTHAKTLVVDDRHVVIGSHNWTHSALTANRELSLAVDDPRLAAAVAAEIRRIPGWDAAR